MTSPTLLKLTSPTEDLLRPLADAASGEGHLFIRRLLDEYRDGTNRFDQPGALLLGAFDRERLIAVCGIQPDPYLADPRVGRIRHLYVLPAHRRRGVGRALLRDLLAHAPAHFHVLTLRTHNPAAADFYASLGFRADALHPHVTHRLRLPEKRGSTHV